MNATCRALAVLVVAAVPAAAQSTRLAVSGFTGAIGTTTLTDFDQGYRQGGNPLTITVDVRNPLPTVSRTTSVYIRADAATMGGSKSSSSISWRRNDIPDTPAAWNTLTTSDVLIQTQTLVGSGALWTNSIWFRVSLDWADTPATYSVGITITLMVTAP